MFAFVEQPCLRISSIAWKLFLGRAASYWTPRATDDHKNTAKNKRKGYCVELAIRSLSYFYYTRNIRGRLSGSCKRSIVPWLGVGCSTGSVYPPADVARLAASRAIYNAPRNSIQDNQCTIKYKDACSFFTPGCLIRILPGGGATLHHCGVLQVPAMLASMDPGPTRQRKHPMVARRHERKFERLRY